MEDNQPSFYEFLAANSRITKEEKKKIHPIYFTISWCIIFLLNSTVVWLGWNYAICQMIHVSSLNYFQSILLYALIKTLTRGFFTVQ